MDPENLDAKELLARLAYRYDYRELTAPAYAEPTLQALLATYQQTIDDAHVLFTATGLRCLQRLKALCRHGIILLSADKGCHRLEDLQGWGAPDLVRHGSFSL